MGKKQYKNLAKLILILFQKLQDINFILSN
jgi:hypothetical protein